MCRRNIMRLHESELNSSILEMWHILFFKVGKAQRGIQESSKEHRNVAFVFTLFRFYEGLKFVNKCVNEFPNSTCLSARTRRSS